MVLSGIFEIAICDPDGFVDKVPCVMTRHTPSLDLRSRSGCLVLTLYLPFILGLCNTLGIHYTFRIGIAAYLKKYCKAAPNKEHFYQITN